jgi:hypothetical protein
MALRMNIQTEPFHPYTSVDLQDIGFNSAILRVSYRHPTEFSFLCTVPQHTFPLGIRNFVQFWDDEETNPLTGQPFSDTDPIFEGFVDVVDPGPSSNTVKVICYDPTNKVANEQSVFSLPWQNGETPSVTPQIGVGAYPRLVLNGGSIVRDADYAYSFGNGATTGGMIKTILDFEYQPLYWSNAVPGDGSSSGNGAPYEITDLDAMTFVPQEKMVYESENVRNAVERTLQWMPTWKMLWYPGARKWRFGDITQSPQVTLTLNQFTGTNDVLAMRLTRSLEGRYTSVKAYGPPQTSMVQFTWQAGGLATVGDPIDLENYTDGGGSHTVQFWQEFQIVDQTQRAGAKVLPRGSYTTGMPVLDSNSGIIMQSNVLTNVPHVEVTFDGVQWITDTAAEFDFLNGLVKLSGTWQSIITPAPVSGSTETHFVPTDVRLTWAPYQIVLNKRAPATGFSGTAYTVANLQNEYSIYDEQLAVDYNIWGQPITTEQRLDQYATLVSTILSQRQDIIYGGQILLNQLEWDYLKLDKRINIAGVDGSGNAVTTGWENVNAFLTDVEYDFSKKLTTLSLSSDRMEIVGFSVPLLKELLRIRDLLRFDNVTLAGNIAFNGNSFIYTVDNRYYIDPVTRQITQPLGQNAPLNAGMTTTVTSQPFKG